MASTPRDQVIRAIEKDCPDYVPAWYDYLKGQGVTMLRELQPSEEIQIRGFFFQGPG